MKRFHQLTKDQQTVAISFATSELKDCIEKGIIHFGHPISDTTIREYATCAAEDAYYAEIGDKVIYDIVEEA